MPMMRTVPVGLDRVAVDDGDEHRLGALVEAVGWASSRWAPPSASSS
jgi:hypothetical protein